MVSLKVTKKNTLAKALSVFHGLLCVLVLLIALAAQNLGAVNVSSQSNATSLPTESLANALVNITYPSLALRLSPANYTITTDGKFIYANSESKLVFGGSTNTGEIDGSSCAAVINAALKALAGNAGRIEISKGSYLVTDMINLGNNTEVYCDAGASFTLGYNGTMFMFGGVSGAALVDATIDGNKVNNFTGTPITIKENLGVASTQNTVSGNRITHSGNRGISIEGAVCSYNNISYNTIQDVAKEGIMVSRSSYNLIDTNTIDTTGCHGIISTGGSYNSIIGNDVENAGGNYVSGYAHGIAVDGNEGANVCYGNVVDNNTVNNAYMVGIEVADGAHEIAITNNRVSNTRGIGIFFGGAYAVSCSAQISGNTVVNCGTQNDQGILVSGVSADNRTWAVDIVNNTVNRAGVDGIRIKWVTDSNVTGNVVHGCGGYGIAFEDSNTDCILIANNNLLSNDLGSLNLNRVNIASVSYVYSNPFTANNVVSAKYLVSRQAHEA